MTAFDAALFSAPSAGGYSAPAHPSAASEGGTGYSAPLPPASNVDYGSGGGGGGSDGDSYGPPVYHGQDGDSYGAPVQRGHSPPSHTGFGFRADDIGNIDLTSGSGVALSSSRASRNAAPSGSSKHLCHVSCCMYCNYCYSRPR